MLYMPLFAVHPPNARGAGNAHTTVGGREYTLEEARTLLAAGTPVIEAVNYSSAESMCVCKPCEEAASKYVNNDPGRRK
jgi:hypothetical protein